MALGYAVGIRNLMLDTITAAAGALALLRIYDGTRPATGGAVTNLLAELTCGVTFAGAAGSGVLTVNAISSDIAANATGTATWFRIVSAVGAHVLDGSAGTSGTDLILGSATISLGDSVAVTAFTVTEGNP